MSVATNTEIDGLHSQTTKLVAYTARPAILAESVSLVITRPVLVDFVARINSIPDRDAKKQVLTFALERVHPRAVSFEEQAGAIREKLADIYEEEGDHISAFRVLQGITLESGQR